jgi:superfamily II DNA/RNA helicase
MLGTGTGKTLAFLLPMINAPKSTVSSPRFLVLCPTRELARQVLHEAQKNAPWVPMLCCHGGVSYQPQGNIIYFQGVHRYDH